MSWYEYKPYVPVAQRRREAEAEARSMSKNGKPLEPVKITGRAIATTFWGKAWCDNLEAYSDYANRLPRGRTYVRNGSVIDLHISAGKVTALVSGSELYKINISIEKLPGARWTQLKATAAGKITNLLDLLQGRLSKEILADISDHATGLFPAPAEIKLNCSCPDWADMCKHVAAVLYGIGARLDAQPELFFTLRGVDMQELISAASKTATTPLTGKTKKRTLVEADLGDIFGVELETADKPVKTAKAAKKSAAKRK